MVGMLPEPNSPLYCWSMEENCSFYGGMKVPKEPGFYCIKTGKQCVGAKKDEDSKTQDILIPEIIQRCPSRRTLEELDKDWDTL